MTVRKNTLLLFSKLPEPGLVKTRLTTLKDGVFAPEVASVLYHCMLFDVVEICCAALAKLEQNVSCETFSATPTNANNASGETPTDITDTYELVISTAPAENVSKMRSLFYDAGEWPRPLKFIADKGVSFDEHYNHAFDQVWESGADCILSMGADMPALTVNDIVGGFNVLHTLCDSQQFPNGGIVLAPDQEMGVSVVGWTRNTHIRNTSSSVAVGENESENVSRETFSHAGEATSEATGSDASREIIDSAIETDVKTDANAVVSTSKNRFTHTGVYYNQDGLTVLPAYIAKAREAGLPAIYLPPIPDVDTMADLMHNITVVEALNYCAQFDENTPPWRTANALKEMGWDKVRVPPNDLRDPRDHIDK